MMPPALRRGGQKGFTLVELMVAMVFAAIVVSGVFHLYVTFFRSTTQQDRVLQMQQNARVAVDDLERDLRLAGLDVTRDDGSVPDQTVFAYAAPYEVVFNANLESTKDGIRPDRAPDKVPAALAGGSVPFYDPSVAYPFAETVRWTLDADADGDIDSDDRATTENPSLYRLTRQVYGYNASSDSNGPDTAVAAVGVRGPDTYPDGTRPPVLFQYWIREIDLNDDKTVDAGEDINGSGTIDQFLWGDDGSGGGVANDGRLDDSEIDALMTGNGGNPKVIDNFNALITSSTGDSRATALTRSQVLSNIARVTVTVLTEASESDPNYASSPHGSTYQYREHAVVSSVSPRNRLTDATADMTLTVSANPADVVCPSTSSLLTVTLLDDKGDPYSSATDVVLTTSLGSFSASSNQPSITLTTVGGSAITTLYGDNTTTATSAVVDASATVGSVGYTASTNVMFVAGPPFSVQVFPDKAALPADGLSTTGVTAKVLDACGKPTGDGSSINWAVATVPPGIGGTVSPATSPISGNAALTTLTAGLASGIATLTATETGVGASGAGAVNFTDCVVTVTPTNPSVPADGTSSTGLAILITDIGGTPQSGVSAQVSTTDGSVSPTTVISDGAGQATAALRSSTTPHTATVSVSVPPTGGFCDYALGTAQVEFSDCGMDLVSDVTEVVPGSPGGNAVITATVSDSGTGTGLSGQGVTFSLTAADGSINPSSATTDASGDATTTFTAGPTTGVATISAATGCGTSSVDVFVRDCLVSAQASPQTVPPASGNQSVVTATLTDSVSGTPLAGRTVNFSIDNTALADFVTTSTGTTNSSGEASVTIATKGLPGVVNVTATSDCGSDSVAVTINDWQLSLDSSLASVEQGKDATLTATVTAGGAPSDPPAGEDTVTITFDSPGSLGSLVSPAATATSSGVTNHTFTAGSTSGTVTARASATVGGLVITDTVEIIITNPSGVNDLVLDLASPNTCSGGDTVAFRVENQGLDDLTVTGVQFTWSAGGQLDRVKTGGSSATCSGGSDLWRSNGCGKPDGDQSSPATLTSFCKSVVIPQGTSYTFNSVQFQNPDMRGEPMTVIITHEPVGGGTTATSTLSFSLPSL
jgi:prepilin-type N-terminal cleavage/methylation domain-containing protein